MAEIRTRSILARFSLVAAIFLQGSGVCFSMTYLVGATRTYLNLNQVAPLLQPGDTVLVDGDQTYAGGVSFTQPGSPTQRIVVHGVQINGHRPLISGGTDAVAFRTDFPYDGPGADHYTFEGFEVTGATNRGIYHQAKDLIIRDVVVHDCHHGILGADQGSGSCLLEYSEVYACGSGQSYHQIYMATDEVHNPGSVFRMQFCYLHDGAGGNNVKSRAERNEIYYNWIEGAYYHELELIGPDGGDGGNPRLKREDSDVMGNVLWKKTKPSGDPDYFSVARIGGDGTGESHGRYRFVNNTILCGARPVFRMFDSLESVEMHNNVFYRIDGSGVQVMRTVEALWTTGAEVISGQNNWVQTGSMQIPSEWTGTITGSDPGFVDLAGGNVRPLAESPLANAGTATPAGPPGYPFPSPAFPPAFVPPDGNLIPPATGVSRIASGTIDMGAFEYDPTSGAEVADEKPASFDLMRNFPNPFNPSTVIQFRLAERADVLLSIIDLSGKIVAVILNRTENAGTFTVPWNAQTFASGVYFCRIEIAPHSLTPSSIRMNKMLLIR